MVRNTYNLLRPPKTSMTALVGDIKSRVLRRDPHAEFQLRSRSPAHHMPGQPARNLRLQELAFTLTRTGREYVRAAIARGMDVDSFRERAARGFFFAMRMNFFNAKPRSLRAARLLSGREPHHVPEFEPNGTRQSRRSLRTHCPDPSSRVTPFRSRTPYTQISTGFVAATSLTRTLAGRCSAAPQSPAAPNTALDARSIAAATTRVFQPQHRPQHAASSFSRKDDR